MPTAEEIPRFIDTQIKPHLNKILRVLGNERPASPLQFIADCFVSSSIPERGHPRAWEESLMSYLLNHDVVARVERAIATCAIHHATVNNPLEYVGKLLQESPAAEEAVPPPRAERTRPPALDVAGGGAGSGGDSPQQSPHEEAAAPPPLSPKSPGSALATSADAEQMRDLTLQSPETSPKENGAKRTTSYDTMSRGSRNRLYQVVRPAVLRAGVEPNSQRCERLRVGERLTIMESREFGGLTRVRCSRGWTSMWTRDNTPILVPADETDTQAVAEYQVRGEAELRLDCDPWSEVVSKAAAGPQPLVQIRVSDSGETFVETSDGWHCVNGWDKMQELVPDWKPSPQSSASLASSAGEGGDPAFNGGDGGGSGSAGSTPSKKMRKAGRTPRKGGRGREVRRPPHYGRRSLLPLRAHISRAATCARTPFLGRPQAADPEEERSLAKAYGIELTEGQSLKEAIIVRAARFLWLRRPPPLLTHPARAQNSLLARAGKTPSMDDLADVEKTKELFGANSSW